MLEDHNLGAYNIWDLRRRASRRLPRAIFEFMDRGSEDEIALRTNRSAIEAIKIRPQVLNDVSKLDMSAEMLGRTYPLPMIIAPTGVADLLWWRGEKLVAAAAAKAGVPFTLATSSTTPVEEIGAILGDKLWYQMYVWEDRALSASVADRAAAAGATTLVITADTPVNPNREFNRRNGFANPLRVTPRLVGDVSLHPSWFLTTMARYWALHGGFPQFANYPAEMRGSVRAPVKRLTNSASVTWDDIRYFRDRWSGQLLIKGILSAEDAAHAVAVGADGVIVSNHGARNFDSTPAPITILPEVVAAVGDRTTVLFDSGVRRGSDIFKAIALGARSVLLGRATLYGLGAHGGAGVEQALYMLRQELGQTMAMAGVSRIADIGPQHLIQPRS
jgi:L-lactate dehydrogenase (cytochrome)/(S)-mandelate dehydrogenase